MLTHFIKSINWVDVVLAALFIRVIFISVQKGFITEVFKLFGVIVAVFVSLHYFALYAALCAKSVPIPQPVLEFIIFVSLWGLITLAFKFLRDGVLLVFKIETTNKGFDQYASGILAVGRALLLCSMVIFTLLLTRQDGLGHMTLNSFGYRIAGKAAPGTYAFLQNNLIGKLFAGEHYNSAVPEVLRGKVKVN